MNETPMVGFVGLGTMGGPMSINVAKAGFPLVLVDTDPTKVAAVARETNGRAAGDSAKLSDCDVIVLMLPTSDIVKAALFDEEGHSRIEFKAGSVVVDMSSSDPNVTRDTGRKLADIGVAMIDAPVSGGVRGANEGTLAVMLGGNDDEAIEKARPIIEAMSRIIRRTGPLGSGHAAKALNNYVAATAFAASSEALAIGQRFGLAQEVLLDIIDSSTGQSWNSTNVLGPHIVNQQFASSFALPLLTKDIRIATQLAESLDIDAPVLGVVERRFGAALDELGNVDHTLAYRSWFGV
jgi:3-hydroxyisobutyrate dehydrogenase